MSWWSIHIKLSLPWLHAAFVLLVVGYGTKMGLAPMHTWKPDAYGEAPGMIGRLLAGGMTSCAFLCVLRFYHVAHIAHDDRVRSANSDVLGACCPWRRRPCSWPARKTSNAGWPIRVSNTWACWCSGSASAGAAIAGSLLHVIHNGICKAGLFMAVGNIHRAYGSKSTDQVQGVLRRLPASGACC